MDNRNLWEKMCCCLSNAEIYAIRFGNGELNKELFGYYMKPNSKSASKSNLFNSLKENINSLKNEFREFLLKYGEIEYPVGLQKVQIFDLVNKWKSCVRPEDKMIYDDLLSIIK